MRYQVMFCNGTKMCEQQEHERGRIKHTRVIQNLINHSRSVTTPNSRSDLSCACPETGNLRNSANKARAKITTLIDSQDYYWVLHQTSEEQRIQSQLRDSVRTTDIIWYFEHAQQLNYPSTSK